MPGTLVSWIGNTDLRAPEEEAGLGVGPIAQACSFRNFDRVVLITDYPEEKINGYRRWLKKRVSCPLDVHFKTLTGPTNFAEIYEAARSVVSGLCKESGQVPELTFHLSPGTPAMAAVWIILGKTRFPAELIESSQKHGVKTASVPFDIAADFIPDLLLSSSDRKLEQLSAGEPPETPELPTLFTEVAS